MRGVSGVGAGRQRAGLAEEDALKAAKVPGQVPGRGGVQGAPGIKVAELRARGGVGCGSRWGWRGDTGLALTARSLNFIPNSMANHRGSLKSH